MHKPMRARICALLAQLEFSGCFACLHVWHALQHPAIRGHFSCSAVMAVLGPRNRSEMVTCTRAARACSRAHAHCWHGWEIPVRGHFSTLQQQHGPIYTHACARAHTHHWHNWSDAMIDCRRVNRLRTGWCCCLCFCCQSDRDCKTCREAEDRC